MNVTVLVVPAATVPRSQRTTSGDPLVVQPPVQDRYVCLCRDGVGEDHAGGRSGSVVRVAQLVLDGLARHRRRRVRERAGRARREVPHRLVERRVRRPDGDGRLVGRRPQALLGRRHERQVLDRRRRPRGERPGQRDLERQHLVRVRRRRCRAPTSGRCRSASRASAGTSRRRTSAPR